MVLLRCEVVHTSWRQAYVRVVVISPAFLVGLEAEALACHGPSSRRHNLLVVVGTAVTKRGMYVLGKYPQRRIFQPATNKIVQERLGEELVEVRKDPDEK